MRALILALVAGCSTHVIDLGHKDAGADAPEMCVCRVPCASTTSVCPGTLGTCGTDHYCSMPTSTCTIATADPCSSTFPTGVCVTSETSTTRCGM